MELDLAKQNLAQVGSVSHKNTLGLFPLGKKKKQKFVVGDDAGVVSCFEMKKTEAQSVFATASEGGAVHSLSLNLNPAKREKVFVSQGQWVVGVRKKGDIFYRLESPYGEPIHHVVIDDLIIYTGCEYIFNLYNDNKDSGFYMCHDRINAMTVQKEYSPNNFDKRLRNVMLGCQDRCVRVLRCPEKGKAELAYEVALNSPVASLVTYEYEALGRLPEALQGRDQTDRKSVV